MNIRCTLSLVQVTLLFQVALLALAGEVSSQDSAEKAATAVSPFVGETTMVLVRLDPQRLSVDKLKLPVIEALGPDAAAAFKQFKEQVVFGIKELQALSQGQPLFASVGIPVSASEQQTFLFRLANSADDVKQTVERLKNWNVSGRRSGDYIVVTPQPSQEAVRKAPTRQSDVITAFRSESDFPLQILILPPRYVWRTIDEISPALPKELGGGPSEVLTRGVMWASIGIDPGELRASATIQSADEEAAQKFAAHLPLLLSSVYDAMPGKPAVPAPVVRLLIGGLQPKAEGSQVKIGINGLEPTSLNLAVFAGIAKLIGQETRRHANTNNFKQILLGMHNYHDVYASMPPGKPHRNKEGKPGLSWRVHILPFVGQAGLYDQFKLDEPWDSPHNKKLIAKMPATYMSNSVPLERRRAGRTTFLAPAGEKTVFGGSDVVKLSNIIDGTSNTVVLVEAKPDHSVIWTKPDDYPFPKDNPLKGVLISDDNKWLVGMGDGSVASFPASLAKETVLHLFQMNDGHPVILP